jgi:hypothetical protein
MTQAFAYSAVTLGPLTPSVFRGGGFLLVFRHKTVASDKDGGLYIVADRGPTSSIIKMKLTVK